MSKNYVKEYKGHKVPEGATHCHELGQGKVSFYKVGSPRVERYNEPLCSADDPWNDCIGDPTASEELPEESTQEWVDGLPPVGCECITLHKGDLVECLYVGKGLGEEYIYQVSSGSHRGEIDRLIGSPKFRPLKTQGQKDREAFIEKAMRLIDDAEMGKAELVCKMANKGFKAPEGE
tara:strand:- start:9136 stop:9666 length:531 start_codon:yes stop_codon:yes gene_type:complete